MNKARNVLSVASFRTESENEYQKDVWDLSQLGVKINLADPRYTISFKNISQDWLRESAKKFIKYCLTKHSNYECFNRLTTLNIFDKFLRGFSSSKQPQDINRYLIIDFLAFLLNQGQAPKTRKDHIIQLRQFINYCAREGWLDITKEQIIFADDIPQPGKVVPRYIPQEVLIQLNQHIEELNPYIRRLVLVLQETGRRISEICNLPFNPIIRDAQGDWFLKHLQSKMKKEDVIPISKEIVAVIQEQQQYVRADWGDDCQYLFPQPLEFCKQKVSQLNAKPLKIMQVNNCLNELSQSKDIKDYSGKIWHFQSHQFRHTVATSMINNGVPIQIVKRYLGHETFEMTMRYAHIHDQTLKEEFARFQGRVVDVTGKVVEAESIGASIAEGLDPNDIDAQWLKNKILAQALPNGICVRPVIKGSCPVGPKHCLNNCGDFRTDVRYLDQHKEQLERTNKIIQWAQANPQSKYSAEVIKENLPIKENLERIISTLESENVKNR